MTYLTIAFFFGLAGGLVGRTKGSSFFLWFLISGLIPFLGLAAAVAYRVELDEPQRQCPGCGRIVKLSDALCVKCGTELEYTDEVLPSESAMAQR